MKTPSLKLKNILLSTTLLLALSACQTTGSQNQSSASVDDALAMAAASAYNKGEKKESLAILERMYKRDSANIDTAVKYAAALRESGRYNRASIVLTPFIEGEASQNASLRTEYASINAAMGDLETAEDNAYQATLLDPQNAEAHHILGIARDAQGKHKQAESSLRKAVDLWAGNPSAVLNNLGLNLAAQGFIDEALDILRKAEAVAPNRKEIERNIRIVSALQTKPTAYASSTAPRPDNKPSN